MEWKEGVMMNIDTRSIVSITEANQNFSRIARLVDSLGSAVIMKNNVPRYIVFKFGRAAKEEDISDELVDAISEKLMEKNRKLYEALAK